MRYDQRFGRRRFLQLGTAAAIANGLSDSHIAEGATMPKVRVTALELLPVRATERTVWLIVRLQTDVGLTGLGEASDAFGFLNTTKEDAARMEAELRRFFELIHGTSPLDIGAYRKAGEAQAADGGIVAATAFSAIEQALWDLAGKMLEVPTYALFGGKIRDVVPVYAKINRATKPRTPEGFAATARAAAGDGFQALKAAPFDGFPPRDASAKEIEAFVETGIAALAAMREAVGPQVELMVDCHGFFDVPRAVRVARELEPQKLGWYEEPVPPEQVEKTVEIRRQIQQPMAGGELLFGVAGFAPLIRQRAVDVIMPDVKHCGGLLELTKIAAAAESEGLAVAPHNPSGPVSTAASLAVCAVLKNARMLELQWGEVEWRSKLLNPPERFENGTARISERPGFGVELNDELVREFRM
jgi:galactonate dehydratase